MSEDEKSELQDFVEKIYEKLKENPSKYGFNLSYSPKSAWSGYAAFLILTINPSSKGEDGNDKVVIPDSPFPWSNDFFKSGFKFNIKKPVEAICYELSRLYACSNMQEDEYLPFRVAREFADNCAVLASLIPFRTPNMADITDEMRNFGINKLWKPIFDIWQPKFIVTLGQPPFDAMRDIMVSKYPEVEEINEKVCDKPGGLSYRALKYKTPKDETLMLIGLPHPAAHGDKGFPTNFPEGVELKDTFLRSFLEKILKPECKGHNPDREGHGWCTPKIDQILIDAILEELNNLDGWEYKLDQNIYGDYKAPVREFAANYENGSIHLHVDRDAIYIETSGNEIIAVIPIGDKKYPEMSNAAINLLDNLKEKHGTTPKITQCKVIDNNYDRVSGDYLVILKKIVKSPQRWKYERGDMIYTCPDRDIEYKIVSNCEYPGISCQIINERESIENIGSCQPGDPCYDDIKSDILRLKTMICRNTGEIYKLVNGLKGN